MRRYLIALTFVVSLFVSTSAAQAVVVDMNALGQTTIAYNPYDRGGYFGVALVPGTGSTLGSANIPIVTSSPPCLDPALSADLGGPFLPSGALCSHGGPVMHSNETFDLTWDPVRSDWSTTRNYVEQFLRDAADGSGTLTSPFADTAQYTDATGRAANSSIYGGGCIDYGAIGGSSCQFGSSNGTGSGHSYPQTGNCPITGTNLFHEFPSGAWGSAPNNACVTDAQIQGELSAMIMQEGLVGRTQAGHTPLMVLMTPPGVETCLDVAGTLCSANGNPPSGVRFCSYHSQLNMGGTSFAYVVLPWTALADAGRCDEPDAPVIPANPSAHVFAVDVGIRLVSPLSQAELAAITNPGMNGWFSTDGSEINDNDVLTAGCVPFGNQLDTVTVGSSAQNPYLLQRESNNGGWIESDPNALKCTPNVDLQPMFVVPSAVDRGDVVEFDGSKTVSTLLVPRAGYHWDFGDGTPAAIGPSVVHTYAYGGTYAVTLTVTDRGGDVQSLTQTITVLGPGRPSPPPPPPPPPSKLHVRIQLVPQSLRSVLRSGVAVVVVSNEAADGIATLSISRNTAKRAHIRTGRGPTVVIGTGTVSGIRSGVVTLHLRLSRAMAAKLRQVGHVTLTVRLALFAAGRVHVAVDAAGRY